MPARTGMKRRGRESYFEFGTNNVECDRTGFKIKANEGSFEWNGLFVRDQSWEERQPLDLLRGLPDNQQPSVARPGTGNQFVADTDAATSFDSITADTSPPSLTISNPTTAEDL